MISNDKRIAFFAGFIAGEGTHTNWYDDGIKCLQKFGRGSLKENAKGPDSTIRAFPLLAA